jgi:hypothetical protein
MKKASKLVGGAALLLSLIGTADSARAMDKETKNIIEKIVRANIPENLEFVSIGELPKKGAENTSNYDWAGSSEAVGKKRESTADSARAMTVDMADGQEKSKKPNAEGSLLDRINDALVIRREEEKKKGTIIKRSDLYASAATIGDTLSEEAKKVLKESDVALFMKKNKQRKVLWFDQRLRSCVKVTSDVILRLTEFLLDENDINRTLSASLTEPRKWKDYILYMTVQEDKRVERLLSNEKAADFLRRQMEWVRTGGNVNPETNFGHMQYKFYKQSANEYYGWLFLMIGNTINGLIERGLLGKDIVEDINTNGPDKDKPFVVLMVGEKDGYYNSMGSCIIHVMLPSLVWDLLFTMRDKGEAWTKELLTLMWQLLSILWPAGMLEESEKELGKNSLDAPLSTIYEGREDGVRLGFDETLMMIVGMSALNRVEIWEERVRRKFHQRSLSSLLNEQVERLKREENISATQGEMKSKAEICLRVFIEIIKRAQNKNETLEETFAQMTEAMYREEKGNGVVVEDNSTGAYRRLSGCEALATYIGTMRKYGVALPDYMAKVYNSMVEKQKTAGK